MEKEKVYHNGKYTLNQKSNQIFQRIKTHYKCRETAVTKIIL